MRNAKALVQKSKAHTVEQVSDNIFTVTSGASGNSYNVFLNDDGSGFCSCPWGEYRPRNDKRSACSHVLSVKAHLAEMDGRRVSAWASEVDAKRQRRPMHNLGDNLVITSRLAR